MARLLRCFVAVGLVALVLTLAPPAAANSPAPFSRAVGLMPGPLLERASPVTVEREDLDIECTGDTDRHPTCKFVATYHLFNPAPAEEELLGAFYTLDHAVDEKEPPPPRTDIDIQLEGKTVLNLATDEQLARMDQIVNQDASIARIAADKSLKLNRAPFRFSLAPGARQNLVFSGRLDAIDYRDSYGFYGLILPAIEARHPVLGPNQSDDFSEGNDEFLYLVSPLSNWAGDPEVHVRIRHRASARFQGRSQRFTTTRLGDDVTESVVLRAKSKENLRFGFSFGNVVHNGGPLIGIGLRFGREELRARLGYEVGFGRFLYAGIVADTNFDNYVTSALTLDAATPNLIFIVPALSFGAGATAQFRKDAATRVGIRTQFGLSLPIVAFTFPIDIYPVENSSRSHVEGGFLATIGM